MPENNPRHPPKHHRGLALLPTLVVSIGLLVLLALSAVQTLHWITGRTVIQEFAVRLIDRNLGVHEQALQLDLKAAVDGGAFIAQAIQAGRYQLFTPAFEDFVAGALAAAPQIAGLLVGAPDGKTLRVWRGKHQTSYTVDYVDMTADPELAAIARRTAEHPTAYWGAPVFREIRQTTYLNYRVPMHKEGRYLGFVAVTISTGTLSSLAAKLSNPPSSLSFMLYGPDAVLAHPLLISGAVGRSEQQPLPTLRSLGDPIIEDLSSLPRLDVSGIVPPPGASAQQATFGDRRYVVFTRPVANYSELPITVGIYSLKSAIDAPLRLFYHATLLALAMLALALIAATIMARTIARPIRRAATGAASIGDLDFDKVTPLSRSYFREINDLAQAFNAMLEGLRAFGRYVPRSLVNRLVKEGRIGAGSEQRTLAIMFTDIVGFTTTCEDMTANEVADFINHHLTLVTDCIEREGGTVDKYIGDAAMAFWGAPGKVDNPAAAACRTALAIKRAMAADNDKRKVDGLNPVRLRIGIHLGEVIVGDIGAPSRINYTIVGDAVNAAQRLEGLGKIVGPNAPSLVLISGEVAAALPRGFRLVDHGEQRVKGKHAALHVFELADKD